MLVATSSVFAQDISTTEVRILEGFKPTIAEANRLNENATYTDTIKKDRTQNYEVVDVSLKSNYKTRLLSAAKVKDDKIFELYSRKVGLAFGNAWTTQADLIYNSRRSKNFSYGVIANHFANKYVSAKNSRNKIRMYAKNIRDSYIVLANLDYERITAFYGDEEDIFRNRFAYTRLNLSTISKEVDPYKLKCNTNFFISDFNEFSENQVHLSSNLSKTIDEFLVFTDISFDNYLRYNNANSKFNNEGLKVFSFSPSIIFMKFGVDFDFMVDFYFSERISLFPSLKVSKSLVPEVLLIYGGLRHTQKRNTLKSLSDENPYIHSFGTNQSILADSIFTQELEFTNGQELYVVMRNVLSKDAIFEGSIAYGLFQDFAHFIDISHPTYSRFQANYINVNQLHINLNYSKKINNIINIHINADYFSWDKDVYHKPNLTLDLSAPVNLRDKIKVTPVMTYMSERNVVDSAVSSLNPRIQANVGLYYSYSKQLSAYFKLNNLTNSKAPQWTGYEEVGFNAVFGVNFSF